MYDDIILFIKLVKFGGFSKTTKQTGILQPTLSRRLKSLETKLNLVLIKRGTRLFSVTEHGQQLYDQFKHLEVNLFNRIDNVVKSSTAVSGCLNIALPMLFAYEIITPYLTKFTQNNPDIKLNIYYQHADINLSKEKYDLAVMCGQPSAQNQKIKLLTKTRAILYCSPKYLVKYTLPNNLYELTKHKIIGIIEPNETVIRGSIFYNIKTGRKVPINITPDIPIVTNNLIQNEALIRTGKIIGIGFEMLLKPKFAAGELIHVLPEYKYGHDNEFYALIPQEGLKTGARAFLEFIETCIKNYRNKYIY